MSRVDAIVVGGGFAGVTAARELRGAGLSTVLLEARDRLGGRTWTVDFAGTRVELGGTWVHWQQPHVWSEMTRYGIALEEDNWDFDVALVGHPPRRCSVAAAFEKVRDLFARYAETSHTVLPQPHDPLLLSTAVAELDQRSMQNRLDEMQLSPDDREWLTGLLFEIAGSPLDQAGAMPVLRWLALCDWDIDKWYETNKYRPAGGTAALIDAMLADRRVDIRLSSAVTHVQRTPAGVAVTTDGAEVIEAARAVIAVPVNVWPAITFSPPLPASHLEASACGMGKPHQDKVWLHVRGEVGRVFAQLPAPAPLNFFWTYRELDDGQLIFGINASATLDVNDPEAVAATIRSYLPEIDEVVGVRAHAWSEDPYSRGGNTCYRPAQLTRYLRALQEPWGPVAFATADIASGWVGYIDGAIESGIRAARVMLGR